MTAVIYFSYTGNTKKIAEEIASKLEGDLIKLTPVRPYSDNYDEVVGLGQKEVNSNIDKDYLPSNINLSKYDKIVIGTPSWWYLPAPVITTFIKNTDFTGKKVYLFMTNAGWPGKVIKTMENLAKKNNANIVLSKEFKFNEDTLLNSQTEVDKFISNIKNT